MRALPRCAIRSLVRQQFRQFVARSPAAVTLYNGPLCTSGACRMNWEAIGAIGENIGAFAVLITLVYLAVQTRQSRLVAERSLRFSELDASRAVAELYGRWRSLLITDNHAIGLLEKAKQGGEIDDGEATKLKLIAEELMVIATFSHVSTNGPGSLHPNDLDAAYVARFFSDHPVLWGFWDELVFVSSAGSMAPSFVRQVEERFHG